MIKDALAALSEGRDLSHDQACEVLRHVLRGEATPAQIGALLFGLRLKGETPDEIAGFADAMLETAVRLPLEPGVELVDTCGTGGDRFSTFNISTAAAFVVAGAGGRVAKHGNRSVSSKCGSADVLEALGVKIDVSPELAVRCLAESGIAFLFAPAYHPTLKHVTGPRRELGVRTIFNLLGPIVNPARPAYQVMGVFHRDYMERAAQALARVGTRRSLVIHNAVGMDEAATVGVTYGIEVTPKGMTSLVIDPRALGLTVVEPEALRGGDANENAGILRRVLEGAPGPHRETVALSAALALWIAGKAEDVKAGLARAQESLDAKHALGALERLRAVSNA
ncbi:MAG: anthranilate phosphoribosyltransferase [Planctomycetes bacterium]|nr:anthranilate phosphoribosyltransferase [Planctomycetota bacterium]